MLVYDMSKKNPPQTGPAHHWSLSLCPAVGYRGSRGGSRRARGLALFLTVSDPCAHLEASFHFGRPLARATSASPIITQRIPTRSLPAHRSHRPRATTPRACHFRAHSAERSISEQMDELMREAAPLRAWIQGPEDGSPLPREGSTDVNGYR